MKKNIIFVTNYFGNGGAATVMRTIINNLIDKNYNILIISFNDDNKKYNLPSNAKYVTLKGKKSSSLSHIIQLRTIFKKYKYSTIISFEYFVNMQCVIANMFLKNKLIISERNDPSKVGVSKNKQRNFLYRFADVLVCQTETIKNYFPNYIRKKTVIISNPIKDNLPKRFIGKRKKIIFNFCRLTNQKNLPMLINAFKEIHKKYPDYKLYIYGDGPKKDYLIKMIDNYKLSKCAHIYSFDNNIDNIINNYGIYVSTSDYEGVSNSMLEAMAMGIPTICTDCDGGGAREIIVNNYNGILIPKNDLNALIQSIEKIITDSLFEEKISINATLIKDIYSEERICKKWIDLF